MPTARCRPRSPPGPRSGPGSAAPRLAAPTPRLRSARRMGPAVPAPPAPGTGPAARTPCRHAGSSSWQAGSTPGSRQRPPGRRAFSEWYPSARQVGGDLDQIAVRIAAIYRPDWTQRAGALHRSGEDRHATVVQMADHLIRRCRGDEAQIAGAGRVVHPGDPASRIGIRRAHVDLLAAELQRGAVVGAEFLALHAEHAQIPGGGDFHVLHVQHDVADAVDGEAHWGPDGWNRTGT